MATKKSAKPKYSPSVGENVETEMKEMKQGTLKSGRNGKKVTNPKQAIAIALSEARKEGKKVPPNPNQQAKKSATKKAAKKAPDKKTAAKKAAK